MIILISSSFFSISVCVVVVFFLFFSRFDILKYVVEKSHMLTSTTEMHSLCL